MKEDAMWLLFGLFGVFLFILGLGVGTHSGIEMNRVDAIQHNAAHYDPKSGAFTWN